MTAYSGGMPRGRILAIKWGVNPNSSSLGVDVTFLLVGATVLAAVTPVIGAVLRWRRRVPIDERSESGGRGPAGFAGREGVRPLSIAPADADG
jgi:hypothetical protein